MAVAFGRPADGSLLVLIAALRAGGGLPEPPAARAATVPAATTAQAPSTASTARMGALGRLGTECLPLALETDVLTTIRSQACQRPPGRTTQPYPGRCRRIHQKQNPARARARARKSDISAHWSGQ